jgi:hypothetical protein
MMFYTLGLGGAVVSLIYYIAGLCYDQFKKRFTAAITIENDDPMFKFMMLYLAEHGLVKKSMTNLTANLEKTKQEKWYEEADNTTDAYKPNITYTPAGGLHKLLFKGLTIYVNHNIG